MKILRKLTKIVLVVNRQVNKGEQHIELLVEGLSARVRIDDTFQ